MKIISHISTEHNPIYLDAAGENWFDNRSEPIVRCGGEMFQTHFEPEVGMEIFTVDPRRSMVEPLWKLIDDDVDSSVAVDDFLACFVNDIGLSVDNTRTTSWDIQAAFHTMLPYAVAMRLAQSWMHLKCFLPRDPSVMRVVNNPFFYTDAHASKKRLLDVAQDNGCVYGVDLSVAIPASETLAHEIARVNHIQDGADAVAMAECDVLKQIQEVL